MNPHDSIPDPPPLPVNVGTHWPLTEDQIRTRAPELAALLSALIPPGVCEVRGIGPSRSEFHTNPVALCAAALRMSGRHQAVYYTLGEIDPATPARKERGQATAEADAVRRRWIVYDLDIDRPKGAPKLSASDAEKGACYRAALAVVAHLTQRGWPEPIIVDSGNGYHICYRVDLQPDAGPLVAGCLTAVGAAFPPAGDHPVKIDPANALVVPHLLVKFPGTLAAKGPDTLDRPHRTSGIVSKPATVELVPTHLLIDLASEAVAAEKPRGAATPGDPSDSPTGVTPLDDFNDRGRWEETGLYAAGWTVCADRGDGRLQLTRPGKDTAVSASVGYSHPDRRGNPTLWVFSSSSSLPTGRAMSKAQVFAHFHHHGDYSAAAKALRGLGYGRQDPTATFSGSPARKTASDKTASGTSGARVRHAAPVYVNFPVEALPERIRHFVRVVSESTNTDPVFTALPLLSVLGAAIGTARAVMPKKGWRVFPTVWGMCVGRSSSGKSPPLAAVNDAVHPLVDDLNDENAEAMSDYEVVKAEHARDKTKKGTLPPPPPPAKRFRVGDITIQALSTVLSANTRGVVLFADELAGWFGGMTRYAGGKGNTDRPHWLSLFDGGQVEVDRKTDNLHISVRNTMVGIAGGIQPGILRTAMTEDNMASGLFARILVAYPPDRLSEWSDTEISDEATAEITTLIRALRFYEPTEIDGRRVPVLNTLHPDAKKLFVDYFTANRARAYTATDAEAAAYVKLESYALRFAHIRHLCRYAGEPDATPISADDVAAGIQLADWFLGELHRVHVLLDEPELAQALRRLADWIRRKHGGRIAARTLQKTNHRRYPDVTAARARLEQLAADGFGEWADEVASNGKTVNWFVLHPEPVSDARHCQTLHDEDGEPASDTAPDTASATVPQTHAPQGVSETVSGSVWRLSGGQTLRGGNMQSETVSDAVSDAPPPLDPARFRRTPRPKAATPAPAASGPAWAADLDAVFTAAGENWTDTNALLAAVAARRNGEEPNRTKFLAVLGKMFGDGECHRRGEGRKGSPHEYRLPQIRSQTPTPPPDDQTATPKRRYRSSDKTKPRASS